MTVILGASFHILKRDRALICKIPVLNVKFRIEAGNNYSRNSIAILNLM